MNPLGEVLGQSVVPLDPTRLDDPEVDACEATLIPQAPIRRLTNEEYRNTVADTLGRPQLAASVTQGFVTETESLGFRNSAQFLRVTPLIARQYMDAAESLAAAIKSDAGVLGCQAGAEGCATQVINSLGRRLFRRSLTAIEVGRYQALFAANSADLNAEARLEAVLTALFQSPSFIHRVEDTSTGAPTGLEIASRLSYLFWRSAPDEALLALGEGGGLNTPEKVEGVARTMLLDEKAHRGFSFFEEWLDIDRVGALSRNPDVFPEVSGTLPASFREEAAQFVRETVFDGDGRFDSLFNSRSGYYNGELRTLHGLEDQGAGGFGVEVRNENAGLLTLGGFLTAHDKPSRTSIVNRGLIVRTNFLCQTVGAPPDDVQLSFPELDGSLTQKERLEQHRVNESCARCHNLMDPLGVIFENFDALGRFRTTDRFGASIDTASEVTATRDADGPVSSVVELAERFSQSDQVRSCFTTQMFRYAFGRDAFQEDACTMQSLYTKFVDSGYNVRELMVGFTQTEAFWTSPKGGN